MTFQEKLVVCWIGIIAFGLWLLWVTHPESECNRYRGMPITYNECIDRVHSSIGWRWLHGEVR